MVSVHDIFHTAQKAVFLFFKYISHFQTIIRNRESDTNRVERHGGKTMRVMQTKTVPLHQHLFPADL